MSDPWDLSALDDQFPASSSPDDGYSSGLDALDDLGADIRPDSGTDDLPRFMATSASGQITVTTHLTGQVDWVDLSPGVTRLSESELEREILAVAAVAALKARAAQNQFVSGLMLAQGQDRDTVRNLVEHHMGLPTMEQASIAEAALTSADPLRDD
ncbi:hypothetical protein JRC04_28125 [Mycolicibacterium sp. S2-37]|uniref:hypothetical protein n=1 Tax=Mycolicibacterium sp. S2-37 TaxID=2810297 RepID=UPI001A94DA20|nr:hypothetical protein [Mycolicibacterium sp. S2-37]MBO0681348.1 hypothetical protein [Mycolicibacterium sp. S2-37]